MTVQLSRSTVEIKDSITWGEKQKLEQEITRGAKISQAGLTDFDPSVIVSAKYLLLEMTVLKITEDGADVKFSRDWMDNLSVEDGEKLYEAVDSLSKKK